MGNGIFDPAEIIIMRSSFRKMSHFVYMRQACASRFSAEPPFLIKSDFELNSRGYEIKRDLSCDLPNF